MAGARVPLKSLMQYVSNPLHGHNVWLAPLIHNSESCDRAFLGGQHGVLARAHRSCIPATTTSNAALNDLGDPPGRFVRPSGISSSSTSLAILLSKMSFWLPIYQGGLPDHKNQLRLTITSEPSVCTPCSHLPVESR